MLKTIFYIGVLAMILAVVVPVSQANSWPWEVKVQPLELSDVADIELWANGEKRTQRQATPAEVQQIIKWINEGKDPQAVEEAGDAAADSGVRVRLQEGNTFTVQVAAEDGRIVIEGRGKGPYQIALPEFVEFMTEFAEKEAQ